MKVVPRFFALRLMACLLFMGSCLELFKGDQKMRTYQVKQKFRLGGERFDIKDELGNVEYQVEGTVCEIDGLKITILEVSDNMIKQAKVEKLAS